MNLNIDAEKELRYDAIVIGSGVSGGWAAKELTEKGLRVLMLERGQPLEHVTGYTEAMKTGSNAGNQFAQIKGLHQIVIGPQLQSLHLILYFSQRREHNDRQVGFCLAQKAAHVQAIPARQIDIQNNQINPFEECLVLPVWSVEGNFGLVSFIFKA